MGLAAVLTWVILEERTLPRWVWAFIAADLVLSIPRTIELYQRYF